MLNLLLKLTDNVYGADHIIPNFLTWWYGFLYLGVAAAIGNDTSLLVPGLEATGFADAGRVLANPNSVENKYMPFGPLLRDSPEAFYKLFQSHRNIPDPTQAYDTSKHVGLFQLLDSARVNEFTYDSVPETSDPCVFESCSYEKPRLSFFPFFVMNLKTEDQYIEAIKHKNKVIAESPLADNAFVYGPISTYWEVFLELDTYLWTLFAVGAVVIFILTTLAFSCDLLTALITSSACFMITLEIYGLSCAFMSFNFYVASISLLGLGLSVEFTAHLAAAFSMGSGSSPSERLSDAMAHTFPAIMEGSISTLLSVLPLAFRKELFIVKYLFGIISLVVAVGLLNGVVFMPGILSLVSQLCPRRTTMYTAETGGGQPREIVGQKPEQDLPTVLQGGNTEDKPK